LFGWNVFILIGEDLRDSVDDVTSHIEWLNIFTSSQNTINSVSKSWSTHHFKNNDFETFLYLTKHTFTVFISETSFIILFLFSTNFEFVVVASAVLDRPNDKNDKNYKNFKKNDLMAFFFPHSLFKSFNLSIFLTFHALNSIALHWETSQWWKLLSIHANT
jgi:hypothetical protein